MRRTLFASALLALASAGAAHAAVTVTSVTGSGTFFNDASLLLIDGDFGLNTGWTDAPNVFWQDQEGSANMALTLAFDGLYTLTDVAIGVDNNDFYGLQVSTNGSTWSTLFVSLPANLDPGRVYPGASMIQKSSVLGDAAYSELIDFAPVQARYARIFAVAGDQSYAVSEVQFSGTLAPVPEPATYGLMAAGLLAVGIAARRRRG